MNEKKQLNKKNISFVVLVGGLGSRIKHLYPDKPKPMISINNKPFLYWLIKEISDLNFKHVIYAGANENIFNSEGLTTWDKKSKLKIVTHHWSSHVNKGFKVYKFIRKYIVFINYFIHFNFLLVDRN